MKRYLLMILGACIAIPLVFASCSSDDDNDGNEGFNMAYYLQGSYTTAVSVSKNGSVVNSNVRTYLTITRVSDTEATFSLDPVSMDGYQVKLECKLLLAADNTNYIKFLSPRTVVNIGGISNAYDIEGALSSLSSLEFYVFFSPSTTTSDTYYISAEGVKGTEVTDLASAIEGEYNLSLDVDQESSNYNTEGGVTITKYSSEVAYMQFHDLSFGYLGVYDFFIPVNLSGNSINVKIDQNGNTESPINDTSIWKVALDGLVTGSNIIFTLNINNDTVTFTATGNRNSALRSRTLARDIYGLFNINYVVVDDESDPAPYSVMITSREPQVRLSLTSPELEDEIVVNTMAMDFIITPESDDDPIPVRMDESALSSTLEGVFGNVNLSTAEEPNSVSLRIQTGVDEDGKPKYETVSGTLRFAGGSVRESHIAELSLSLSFTYNGNSYNIDFSGEGLQDF